MKLVRGNKTNTPANRIRIEQVVTNSNQSVDKSKDI
jgi:hypothetical protein